MTPTPNHRKLILEVITVAKRTYYRKQSEESITALHEALAWKFEDNDLLFSIEKFETWRFLIHIKANGQIYRLWHNYGSGFGRTILLEDFEKNKKPAH